ncbi:conserved Plasmodium protein, unknown function [Plasmodium gallinaceum]|uniref:Pre-mRNA-splicing factor CWF7 n=1 Tax=Plasmodium gallinaceum TaxID=5849 RepID=A0A1J1GN90_PLAGA|nr:conserved Plasmodium protein, unknown function [Plasmodium gallinaceum]CRG93725.1 conserved Plasmodium protein, unknown function [Plasmodium gallinaceum]
MEIEKRVSDEEKCENSLNQVNDKYNKEKKRKLYELNDLHHLVNALPYIDSYDNEFEQVAKKMVEEEMKLMNEKNEVKNYLEDYQIPSIMHFNNENSIIHNELKRCEENKKMEKINFDHYNISHTLNDMSINEWKNTLKKYEIILENSHNALINIELMNKYREVMWSEHMKIFSHIDINLQNNIKSLKEDIENINKKRKLHQLNYANEFTTLQNERKEYKRKNNMVLNEIKKLLSENMLMQYKKNLI